MPQTPRVPVNGGVLRWARKRTGLSIEDAAARLHVPADRLEAWEDEGSQPTLAQLRNVASLYRQTVAFFLRAEPPATDDATRPPDYRSRQQGQHLSLRLVGEIDKAAERRNVFVDLTEPPPVDLPALQKDDPLSAAALMRAHVGVTVQDQQSWNAQAAFRNWSEQIERLGILIFHMSRVDPDECQGFSLYFDRAPVVVLNGADTPQVRIFTLLHEVGHLLHRTGGVCHTMSRSAVEWWCNAFAANFLMPRRDFLASLDPDEDFLGQVPFLATRYRVSWSAVAVGLRSVNAIDQAALDDYLAQAADIAKSQREAARERARTKGGGPPHHLTHLRNLSPRYVYTVLDAVQEDKISPVDASYFLESKWSTIRRMEDDLQQRTVDI